MRRRKLGWRERRCTVKANVEFECKGVFSYYSLIQKNGDTFATVYIDYKGA